MSFDCMKWAMEQNGLRPMHKLLLLAIANRCNSTRHECWPSTACLEADTGMNKKTVFEALKVLEAKKFIVITRANGQQNTYRIPHISTTENGTPPIPKTGQPENGTGTENGTPPIPKTEQGYTENGMGTYTENGTLTSNITNHRTNQEIHLLPAAIPQADSLRLAVDEKLQVPTSLTLNTGELYPVTFGEIEIWQDLYPAIDVLQEVKKMQGWLLGNPKRRKTRHGIGRFIQSWLSRAQDGAFPSDISRPQARSQWQKDRQNSQDLASLALECMENKYGE